MKIDYETRWTPVRKGNTFCAPGCGRGCTVKEYDEVVHKANELASLLGEGWEPTVWDNLGWRYCVRKTSKEPGCRIEVHPPKGDGAQLYFVSGHFPDQIVDHLSDPQKGIASVLKKARLDAEKTLRALGDF